MFKKGVKVKKTKKGKEKIKDKLKNIKMFKNNKHDMFTTKEVVIVMLFSLGIGFLMCFGSVSLLTGNNYIAVLKDLDKVVDTYYAIVDNYYGDLDKSALIDGAVEGMINSVGDSYTSYSSTDDTSSFDETIGGSYEGIGCSVVTYSDGKIVVSEIFEGSPASKAGLKVGDIVVGVDGKDYTGKTGAEVSNYI